MELDTNTKLKYLIDFSDKSEGLYTLKGTIPFDPNNWNLGMPRSIMITTDPDLEGSAMIIESKHHSEYTPFTIDQMKSGKVSLEILKSINHTIVVGEQWELTARLIKIWPFFFEFRFAGGERLWISEFGLGEPEE